MHGFLQQSYIQVKCLNVCCLKYDITMVQVQKNMYVYTLLLDELESYVEVIVVCFSCRRTLQLARQLKDRAVEAQACYSLGNTYTLLQDYERAIDYHLKHLIIAQDLKDRYTGTGTVSLCCCSSWRLTLSLSVCV